MISSQNDNSRQRLVRRSRAYLAALLLGGVGAGTGLTVAAHASTATTAHTTTPSTTSTPSAKATASTPKAAKATTSTPSPSPVQQPTSQTASGSSHSS